MLTICAPRGRIILLKDYGDKATCSKNFLIFTVFLRIIFYDNSKLLMKFLLLITIKCENARNVFPELSHRDSKKGPLFFRTFPITLQKLFADFLNSFTDMFGINFAAKQPIPCDIRIDEVSNFRRNGMDSVSTLVMSKAYDRPSVRCGQKWTAPERCKMCRWCTQKSNINQHFDQLRFRSPMPPLTA